MDRSGRLVVRLHGALRQGRRRSGFPARTDHRFQQCSRHDKPGTRSLGSAADFGCHSAEDVRKLCGNRSFHRHASPIQACPLPDRIGRLDPPENPSISATCDWRRNRIRNIKIGLPRPPMAPYYRAASRQGKGRIDGFGFGLHDARAGWPWHPRCLCAWPACHHHAPAVPQSRDRLP